MSAAVADHTWRDQDLPVLVKSEETFRISLVPGEKYTQKISVSAQDKRKVKGIVTSDHRRILLSEAELNSSLCELMFGIDTKGLREGDHIDGSILFITNLGEDAIPVHVEIVKEKKRQHERTLRTLDDFAEVCQRSLREGFRVYTGGRFQDLLAGNDAKYRALYAGMSHNPVTYQHMEEFLVAAGRKEALEFSIDREEASFIHLEHSERSTLYLYKNTWGYAQLDVEVQGDFLHVLKKQITTDGFVGKVFSLDFIVDFEKLGSGIRRGAIIIRAAHQTMALQVAATRLSEEELVPDHREKQRLVTLTRTYLEARLFPQDADGWTEDAREEIRALREMQPEKPAYMLCEAALAYEEEDPARVMECLWPMKEGEVTLEDNREKAAYLYLAKAVGLLPDENRNILPRLKAYYQAEPESYLLLNLMLREGALGEAPEKRLERLKLCYEAGCNSPFLLQDAWSMISADDKLLRRLDPFMIRVLQFAARYELLTEAHHARIAFLSHNLKRFSPQVYELLAEGWKLHASDELLEAVNALIIKGQPVQKQYHAWYARAIAHDLRITNLYEYYMNTIEEVPEEGLPVPVLLYFAANDTLDARHRAFLYASIIRAKSERPEFYQMYLGKMHAFAEQALERGLINDDFALLYQTFFMKPREGRTAALMAGVLFVRRLVCEDPAIQNVYVSYEGIAGESRFPVIDGIAYPAVYAADAALVFEDSARRRLCTGISYELTPVFEVDETAAAALRQNVRQTGLLYYGCGTHPYEMRIQESNLHIYRLAAEHEGFTDRYRQAIRRKLIDYYLGRPGDFGRIEFVGQLDPERYAAADKAGTVSLLMEEGRYEDVFHLITEYGYERVGEGDLLQLASRLIMRRDQAYDEELLYLTMRVYKSGKYDDNMLVYLREYLDGPVRTLSGLWKKLSGFQLETVHLAEKILKQSVFSHVFPHYEDEIVRDYVRARGSMKVVSAYLGHASRAYLTAGRPMPEELFTCAELLMDQETVISTGTKISLLKYYSEQTALTEARAGRAEALLTELTDRGIRFGFFQKLPPQLIEKYQITDKLFIEEHLEPGARVTLHYRLQEGAMVPGQWIHEPMKEMYHGIYVKELLLFYGETMTWYISVAKGDKERNLKEQQAAITSTDLQGDSRFSMLNRMLKARADGDEPAFAQELDKYLWKDAYVKNFLQIME